MLKPLVHAAATATALAVSASAQAFPTIFVGAYRYDCCGDPGPRDYQLRAFVDETAFPLPGDIVKPEVPLGTGLFGLDAYARGFITNDLITWGGHVRSPNMPSPSALEIAGGSATVSMYRTFRKDDGDSFVRFIFPGYSVIVTANTEGGPRCPVGDPECLLAKNFVRIGLYDENDELIRDYIEWIQVRSVDTSVSPTGYVVERPIGGGAFLYATANGREGASITLRDATDSPGYIGVSIESLLVDQVFKISVDLLVQAYDRGSTIGPGRMAEAFARDPLDDSLGMYIEYRGVTEIDLEAPPTGVPAPAGLMLLGPLALVVPWAARRGRPRA